MRTARWSWSCCLLALAVVLGCASSEGVVAQERGKPDKPASAPTKKPKAAKGATKKKEEVDPVRYRVKVIDKSRTVSGGVPKPFTVSNAVVFVPEVTLFGGGSGDEVKQLSLRRGSADVTVPFSRIEKLEFGEAEEDRLPITVSLRGVKGEEARLLGTVKASLELRGKLGSTELDSVVRLRDTQSVEFVPQAK